MATLGAVDRANTSMEEAINYAKTQGKDSDGNQYFFIDLILRNAGPLAGSPELFAVSGIRELTPLEPTIDRNGGTVFHFDEQKGGYTRFKKGIDGQFRYAMWDDPDNHNRRFLASHWEADYWEIEDPVIENQIFKLYEQLQVELKKENPMQEKLAKLQREYKGADEKKKKGIMEQLWNLISSHANEVMPPPEKGKQNTKHRQKYRIPPTPEQMELARNRPREERVVVQEKKTSVVRVDSEHK